MNGEEVSTLRTEILRIAAEIIRREYLPSLEKCRTIQHARQEVQRMDNRHVDLAMRLKELVIGQSSLPTKGTQE